MSPVKSLCTSLALDFWVNLLTMNLEPVNCRFVLVTNYVFDLLLLIAVIFTSVTIQTMLIFPY